MLTTQQIVNRRTTYACCAMDYLNKFVQADIYGDTKCANDNWDKAVLMYWAQEQMCNTPVLDGEQGCNTVEFATQVAAKADCFCKQCGCEPVSPTVPPVPTDCTITPNYTVIAAVDVDQRLIIEADSPTTGDSYYVVTDSGGSGWTVNTVVTWNGGGWDAVTVQPSEVILATQTNAYWTPGTNNEPGLLFPPLIGYLVAFNNQYVIQSTYPWISNLLGRNALVRGFVNGAWQIIYSGPESALAEPTTYDFQTLPITALQVVYLVSNGCSYTAGATVVPPFGECGDIVVVITPVSDCSQSEFSVNVDIQSVDGYPLGNIVYSINGVQQTPIAAALGVTTLGPFATGSVIGVRITNAQDSECDLDAGTFTDPSYLVPDITVNSAVDASFQGSAVPGETYLIVSDTTGAGNTWADHVGEVTNIFLFTPLNNGEVVEVLSVPGFDRYWQRVGGLTVQMYPSVTIENTQLYPLLWTIVSDNPTSAATRFRPTVVEGLFGAVWYPIWAGLETQLATPQTVDISTFGAEPDAVRVVYYPTGGCPITVDGSVVNDDIDTEIACDEVNYYQYNYVDGATKTWTFTSPSGSVDVVFVQGSMPTGVIIRAYDGPDNLSPILPGLTGNFPDLAAAAATATSGTMFIELSGTPSPSVPTTPWIFGVVCTPAALRPQAAVTPMTDCNKYNFVLDVDVFYTGDSPGGVIDVQYRVVGSSVINTVENVGLEIIQIGPFPYGSQVEVYLIHLSDPLANVFTGIYTDDGLCPADPCLPDIFQRAEYAGDYDDIATIVPSPVLGNTFFVLTNSGGPSPAPGDLLTYDGASWGLTVSVPEGAYVFAGYVQGGLTSFGGTVFVQGGAGPINFFEPISVAPNPFSTGPEDAWTISLLGDTGTDRNILLDVLVDGVWVTVWTGTESDLDSPINIQIDDAFTIIRTIYNYDTCPVEASYYITTNGGLVTP